MLDLDKIIMTVENEIKARYRTQKEFAIANNLRESEITKDKNDKRFHSLNKLQKYAEWLHMDIEPLVLPGLTQAAEYIQGNVYAPNQKGVNKSGSFGQGGQTGMGSYNVNKSDKEVEELRKRYFACVDETRELYQEIRRLERENAELKRKLE